MDVTKAQKMSNRIISELWNREPPAARPCKWWVDDGQGGGWIEYITPEEWERRNDEQMISRHLVDFDAEDAGQARREDEDPDSYGACLGGPTYG